MAVENIPLATAKKIATVPDVASLPTAVPEGSIRYVQDIDTLYTYNGSAWAAVAGGGGGGSGTVTSVAVVSSHGLAGVVANPTTAASITLSTTVTGVVKGDGTSLSAATVGTDYSVGTSALATGLLKSTTATGALSIATVGTDYSVGTSALATGILKSTTATGALSIAAGSDLPTGIPAASIGTGTVGNTEFGYLAGVTSAIQTQLNAKQASGNYITALTTDVTAAGPGSVAATIAVGAVTDTKASLANKPAITVVATTNQALTGTPTIDGQATAAGSHILLTAQTAGAENGPWVAAAGAWSRPTWYPAGGTTQAFQFITTLVRLGTVYQGTTWRMTTAGAITIDTTVTAWAVTPFSPSATTFSAAVPVAIGGTGATTAATARSNLGVSVVEGDFYRVTPANDTIVLQSSARFAYTIDQLFNLKTTSGTITLAIQINGTNVTSLSALAVTSTPQSPTASGANSVAIGDRVTVVCTSNSSAASLEFSLKGTR